MLTLKKVPSADISMLSLVVFYDTCMLYDPGLAP